MSFADSFQKKQGKVYLYRNEELIAVLDIKRIIAVVEGGHSKSELLLEGEHLEQLNIPICDAIQIIED